MNSQLIIRISAIILLLSFVIIASDITAMLWGNHDDRTTGNTYLILTDRMTVAEYVNLNGIPHSVLLKIFNLTKTADTVKSIGSFGYNKNELINKT
jgi:hypothetical protein